jgi:hypothetical protein
VPGAWKIMLLLKFFGLRIMAMISFMAEYAKEPKNQSIMWFRQECGIPLQLRMCDKNIVHSVAEKSIG